MLDTAIQKRIDDCRDTLVGKVPDPKSQVEQNPNVRNNSPYLACDWDWRH